MSYIFNIANILETLVHFDIALLLTLNMSLLVEYRSIHILQVWENEQDLLFEGGELRCF